MAAYDADIDPLLCLTKADLAGPDEVLGYYAERFTTVEINYSFYRMPTPAIANFLHSRFLVRAFR